MNPHLLSEFGEHRRQAHAVRLLDAIAATFADFFVDDEALSGFFQQPSRSHTALLGRALLIVNDDGYAGELFQFGENDRQIVAQAQLCVLSELRP